MARITADQSQLNLDFSPVRMLITMWLLRTSYSTRYIIATIPVQVVVLFSEWVWSQKQSKHSRMIWTIQILKNCYSWRLWRPHIYYCCSGAKKCKCFKHSHGPKTPLVACVFYFVLKCTFFWLNVNSYACFWQLLLKKYHVKRLGTSLRGQTRA